MVLCKYFQLGNCRFGTKCNNEHFDVKQIIKTDVEAAINGKQWPFSCFGPFKDKPCIPNFIDDQSFEEIRFLCYEAKKKNYFEQFHQQFTKEAIETTGKMKALLQLTPDVVEVVSRVYDTPVESGMAGGATLVKSNNPFSTATANSSLGASNSLFSKPIGNTGAGIFGGAGGNNAFGATVGSSSIFGSGNNATVQNNSIFGGNNNLFGAAQSQQNSFFSQQPVKEVNSVFGSAQQNNVFGQSQTNNIAGGNIFAQAVQQNNPSAAGGIFGQTAQPQMPTDASGNAFRLFGQTAQQTAPAFVQQPPPPTINPFAQANQPQTDVGIFGQNAQLPTGGNIFAQAVQAPVSAGSGLFGNPTMQAQQNLFAQQTQQQQQPQMAPNTNIFAQAVQQMQPQAQTPQPPSGFFQQTTQATQQQLQQQQVVPLQSNVISSTIYSKMEELSAEEIEAFKADAFQPGKIPFSPPPREFIN